MNYNNLPHGVWPTMVTPFNEDLTIDLDAYFELIDFYIENNCAGLFATCGSSEIMQLKKDEMIQLAETAMSYTDGRLSVIAGAICSGSIDEQVTFIKQIYQTGVEAVVIAPCQFVDEQESEDAVIEKIYEMVDKTDGIPLGIYECPYPYWRKLSPASLKKIADTGRFIFHKDTCCDVGLIAKKLDLIKGSPLKFFNANLAALPDSLEKGGSGYCGVMANFFPGLLVRVCELYFNGSGNNDVIWEFLLSAQNLIVSKYPMSAKIFLAMRNLPIKPVCRKKVDSLEYNEILELKRHLQKYDGFIKKMLLSGNMSA